MQINLFSVDLKLVEADDPAKRGFRLLEFNDGLRSGFEGYNALGGKKMVTGRVAADYEELFPAFRLVDLNGHGGGTMDDPRRALLIPRGDRLGTMIGRTDLVIAQRMENLYATLNSNLHFKALCENKAYQSHMAEEMGADDLFPRTQILPTHTIEALAQLDTEDRAEHYVLKPLTLCGGTGLRLIAGDRLEKDLARYFKQKRWIWQKDDWIGLHDPASVLQDRITANKVETEKGVFDGTMRVAFSIYGEGADMQCHIHDAYWKLPAFTIEEDEGAHSIVSYSPANLEKSKRRGIAAMFRHAEGGVKSAAVAPDTTAWLFPKLQDDLARYFSFVAGTDHLENTKRLLQAESAGRQTLGVMMATQPAFYPAASGAAIETRYPEEVVEAIGSAEFAKTGMGHAFKTLRRITYGQGDYMHCENGTEEFETPLRAIVEGAGMRGSNLMDMMQFALRVYIK